MRLDEQVDCPKVRGQGLIEFIDFRNELFGGSLPKRLPMLFHIMNQLLRRGARRK